MKEKKKETKKQKKRNLDDGEVMEKNAKENKKKRSAEIEKKRGKEKGDNIDISDRSQATVKAVSNEKTKVKKGMLKNKKKKKPKVEERNSFPVDDQLHDQMEDDLAKSEVPFVLTDDSVQTHKSSGETANADAADNGTKIRNRNSKKPNKKKKRDPDSSKANKKSHETTGEIEEDVYQISSGDEDCSRGMKKWVTDYYTSRPGLNELQKRIDDFITAHEERLEQERKEREAKSAEGGWTVVVHHKGRKKTTDSESGITVGSVAQAAVEDKMAKKKQKVTVAQDFYRFQKREAHRNEIMALQSKFEQDKKRIQQLRAARKFKPY